MLAGERTTAATRVSESADSAAMLDTDYALLPHKLLCVISGFRREVDEKYAFLVYYAASSGSFLPTFQDNQSVPLLARIVGMRLPLLAA